MYFKKASTPEAQNQTPKPKSQILNLKCIQLKSFPKNPDPQKIPKGSLTKPPDYDPHNEHLSPLLAFNRVSTYPRVSTTPSSKGRGAAGDET